MFQKGIFIPLVILIFQTFIIASRYDIKAQERRRLLLHVLETSVTFFKYLKQKAIYDGKMWKKISKHATARASCWLKGLFPQGFVIFFISKQDEHNSIFPCPFHIVKMFEYQGSKDRKTNFREFFFHRTCWQNKETFQRLTCIYSNGRV